MSVAMATSADSSVSPSGGVCVSVPVSAACAERVCCRRFPGVLNVRAHVPHAYLGRDAAACIASWCARQLLANVNARVHTGHANARAPCTRSCVRSWLRMRNARLQTSHANGRLMRSRDAAGGSLSPPGGATIATTSFAGVVGSAGSM